MVGDFPLLASALNLLGIVLPNVVRVLLGSLGSDVAKMKHFRACITYTGCIECFFPIRNIKRC